MNEPELKKKHSLSILWLVVIFAIVLAIGAYFYLNKKVTPDNNSTHAQIINVSAEGGVFTPRDFTFRALDPVSLLIEARDKDYSFIIKDAGKSYILKAGTVTEIAVGDIGQGTHEFSCGAGCAGTITLTTKEDTED